MANLANGAGDPRPKITPDDVVAMANQLGESHDLVQLRQQALKSFYSSALPNRSASKWKYTKATSLLSKGKPWTALIDDKTNNSADLDWQSQDLAGEIVLRRGLAPIIDLGPEAKAAGLVVTGLDQALSHGAPLGQLRGDSSGVFEAFNGARFDRGVYVRLPRGQKLEKALRISVPLDGYDNVGRLLVEVEDNAALTLIEDHYGGQRDQQANTLSELFVGQAARLRHVHLQRWDREVTGYQSLRAKVGRDGDYLGLLASLGGAASKIDTGALLAGQGARAEVIGFILGDGQQRHDVHTEQHHQAAHSWSNINFKVALADKAQAAYTGLIHIDTGALHSEAFQENRNLLLSDTARAHSIPILEILNQEVSCSHGATVSALDENLLWYLMSRGITRPNARRLVLRAFLQATLEKLPEALVATLERSLDPRLANLAES